MLQELRGELYNAKHRLCGQFYFLKMEQIIWLFVIVCVVSIAVEIFVFTLMPLSLLFCTFVQYSYCLPCKFLRLVAAIHP